MANANYINIEDKAEFEYLILSKANGKTIAELSTEIGFNKGYLCQSLSRGRITKPALFSLARAIDMSPNALIEYAMGIKKETEKSSTDYGFAILGKIYDAQRTEIDLLQKLVELWTPTKAEEAG